MNLNELNLRWIMYNIMAVEVQCHQGYCDCHSSRTGDW